MFFALSSSLCLCFWFSVLGGHFHFVQYENDELILLLCCIFCFLATIQSSLPVQNVVILSHTFPRLCHPHSCSQLMEFFGSCFIIFACGDCHLFTFLKESSTAFECFIVGPPHGTRHIFCAIFSYSNDQFFCTHTFLDNITCFVFDSRHTSHLFCLFSLILDTRFIFFVFSF